MQKASNLIEVSQIFDPQKALTRDDKEIHTDIYQNIIKTLKTKILINQVPSKTFFIYGQAGMGKSTALNYLADEKIEDKYELIYLPGKELFVENDIDVIDVLLMIGFKLTEGNKLADEYFVKLEELQKINLDLLVKSSEKTKESLKSQGHTAEASLGVGTKTFVFAKLAGSVFKNLKRNEKERETLREIFNIDKAELIRLVNQIIYDYEKEMLDHKKRVLLVIDDLEKIENRADIERLFITNNWVFNDIGCLKIVPIPVYLTRITSMFNNDLIEFDFRISENPLDNSSDSEETVKENRALLKELIQTRMQDHSFIDDRAYDEIINLSGGNIRQLIEIIYQSAIQQLTISDLEGTQVSLDDVISGAASISSRLSKAADAKIRVLGQIAKNHKLFSEPTEQDKIDFDNALLDNLIFLHKNGTHWYDVNPMIKKTVEVYAKE